MITVFKEVGKEVIKTDYENADNLEVESGSWIHISEPDAETIEKIAKS